MSSSTAEKIKWEALRTTPRGRGLVKTLVVNPGRISPRRLPSAQRAKQRQQMRDLLLLRLQREAECGVDPSYIGGLGPRRIDRSSDFYKQWKAEIKAWDRVHASIGSEEGQMK